MGVSVIYSNSGILVVQGHGINFMMVCLTQTLRILKTWTRQLVNHPSVPTKFIIELDLPINQFFIQVVVMHQRVIPRMSLRLFLELENLYDSLPSCDNTALEFKFQLETHPN